MTIPNGKGEDKSVTDEKLPVLNQNYKNDLCKSCPFTQSSPADAKNNVCTRTHACVCMPASSRHVIPQAGARARVQGMRQCTKDEQQKKPV